jgi:Glucosidase II beta subunit-like protein
MRGSLSIIFLAGLGVALATVATPRELDLFYCKACGAHVFDAHDHLPSLRLKEVNNDGGATLRAGPRTKEEMGSTCLRYHSKIESEGDDKPTRYRLDNFTILKVDGHEALTAPNHYYHFSTEDEDGADQGRSVPTLLASAFDAGVDVTVSSGALPRIGSASTVPSGHHDNKKLPRQAIPDYEQRPVQCGRCGALLGYYFSKGDHKPPPPIRHLHSSGNPDGQSHAAAGSDMHQKPASSSTSANPGTVSPVSYTVLPFVEGEDDEALGQIDGGCLTLNSGGWWRYKWCHKEDIRQFHQDPVTGHVDPDWSLGSWEGKAKKKTKKTKTAGSGSGKKTSTKKKSSSADGSTKSKERVSDQNVATSGTKKALYYTSHFYSKGQRCDENGKFRATEVQFYCCPSSLSFGPHIEDIVEPSLCRYVMRVCIPRLCIAAPAPTTAAVAATTSTADASSDVEVADTEASATAKDASSPPVSSAAPSKGDSASTTDNSQSALGERGQPSNAARPPRTRGDLVVSIAPSPLPSPAAASASAASGPLDLEVKEGTKKQLSESKLEDVKAEDGAESTERKEPAAADAASAYPASPPLPEKFILAFWGALVEEGGTELDELLSPASKLAHPSHAEDAEEAGEDDEGSLPFFASFVSTGVDGESAEAQQVGDASEDPIYDRLPMATGISPVRFG